ncbi:hypothetical protein, partial [Aeromonas caviae]
VHREDRLSHPGRTDAVNPVLVNRYPQIDTLTERKSRLYIQSIDALDAHLTFFARHHDTFFKPIQESSGHREPTREILNTLDVADTYRPFDAYELGKVRISHMAREHLLVTH